MLCLYSPCYLLVMLTWPNDKYLIIIITISKLVCSIVSIVLTNINTTVHLFLY